MYELYLWVLLSIGGEELGLIACDDEDALIVELL